MRRTFLQRIRQLLRDTAGVNIVEAAIITPLLMLLTFSVVDFASLFYVYLALENGLSQATRYAVTGQQMPDPANPATPMSRMNSIKAVMRSSTPTLTITDAAFSFAHMAPGGTSWTTGVGGPGDIEKVSVDYTWNIMTPLLRPFFANGQVHFLVNSVMKNESRFQ